MFIQLSIYSVILPFLETMITQVCNLSCRGCTNYSDLTHQGYVPWNQGRDHIQSWLSRMTIENFGIIGGEPLINPEWRLWILGARSLLPKAQLRFTTNGLLLGRAQDILEVCEAVGNIVLKITVHVPDEELQDQVRNLQNSRDWTPVKEHGIHRWMGQNGVRLQINYPRTFLKTYKNSYKNMEPWNSDPAQAFEICCQPTCPLLYQDKIYKCSTSALLADTLEKFGKPNIEKWMPYIPVGISVDDADCVIEEFCENFGRPHRICGQCPSDISQSINHLHTVSFKKKTSVNA